MRCPTPLLSALLVCSMAWGPALADETDLPAFGEPAGDAVIARFYALAAAGDADGAWALTDGSIDRATFDATWKDAQRVELYTHYSGETYEGFLLANVDHCVERDGVYTNWQGLLRLKRVDGAWRIHDWDSDTMAYSIGDACWEGGYAGMLRSMDSSDGATLIGGAGDYGGLAGIGALESGQQEPRSEPPPERRGRVELVTLVTTPAGEEGGTEKVLARRGVALKYCYERVLQSEPALSGTLALTFEVGTDGVTTGTKVGASLHHEVDGCVLRQVSRLRFPPPTAAYVARVAWEMSPAE
jgi:hypothetical protein